MVQRLQLYVARTAGLPGSRASRIDGLPCAPDTTASPGDTETAGRGQVGYFEARGEAAVLRVADPVQPIVVR